MESIAGKQKQYLGPSQQTAAQPKRVLWFANTPSLGRSYLDNKKTIGTSWIEALEGLLSVDPNIEVAIAFVWPTREIKTFRHAELNTQYYAVPRRPFSNLQRWINRILCTPARPNPSIENCLEIVDRFQPDVITFFGTETLYPLIIPHIKTPNIIWFQGNLSVYHLKWHTGISVWQSLRYEKFIHFLMGKTDYQRYRLYGQYVQREKLIFNSAQHFIGRTDWDRRLVSAMSPNAGYHHCDEPMRSPFHNAIWKKHHRGKTFIIYSTFRPNLYKGLETAMQSLQILLQVVDQPVEWRIAGMDEQSTYARTVFKMIDPNGRGEMKLLGNRSASEIASELLDADLFVHPSHIDNSPNSLCEAMLMGLPCVATNVGGIPSIMEDRQEGLLVQNGDPFALAGAILEVINDRQLAIGLGQGARRRGLVRNDNQIIKSTLLQIYQNICTHVEQNV